MKNRKLPDNFLLGGSNSGPQTEGATDKNNDSIFDYWFKNDKKSFYDEVGPVITSNMYKTYVDDVKLMKSIGIKIYRTSIQWTRLIKNLDTFEVDEKGVNFYRNYFSEIKKSGIKLIVNLFHFDIPIVEHLNGGWESKKVTDNFAKYAKICFETFGDIVDDWATMNEPIVISESFYAHDFWWPGLNDFKKSIQVSFNLLLASAKAIREFRKLFSKNSSKKIHIILNLSPAIPKDNSKENLYAAEMSNLFSTKFFMDASVKGEFNNQLKEELIKINCLPEYTENELEIIKNNIVDYIGVNYYAPRRVMKPNQKNTDKINMSRYFDIYQKPGIKINKSRGWEIFPEGLREIHELIKKEYNNITWYVSENGIGIHDESQFLDKNGIINDTYRIEFIKEHLSVLSDCIEDGANCFAYCVWTPLDCWSWANAYKNRYGLISVDIGNQKRTLKQSAKYFKIVSDSKVI